MKTKWLLAVYFLVRWTNMEPAYSGILGAVCPDICTNVPHEIRFYTWVEAHNWIKEKNEEKVKHDFKIIKVQEETVKP